MARLENLEYTAEFLRGWPVAEPTAEMNYPSDAAFGNGDLVMMAADGKVTAATDNAVCVGVVVRGSNDRGVLGASSAMDPSVPNIVIFGNAVLRTSKVAAGNAVGAAVGVVGGVWDDAATATTGIVLEVDAAGNNVILLK